MILKSNRVLIVMIMVLIVSLDYVHCDNDETGQQPFKINDQQMLTKLSSDSNILLDRFLAVQRQIAMSSEMIRLYKQRLEILYKLKQEYNVYALLSMSNNSQQQLSPTLNQIKQNKQEESHEHEESRLFSESTPSSRQDGILRNSPIQQDSPYYTLINQYSVRSGNKQSSSLSLADQLILLPPFVINKVSSYVTLITQLNNIQHHYQQHYCNHQQHYDNHQHQQQSQSLPQQSSVEQHNIQQSQQAIKGCYDFSHANKLLFYSKQNTRSNTKINQIDQQQKHILTLALEIKPNKIKTVKITYYPKRSNFHIGNIKNTTYHNNNTANNSSHNDNNNFIIDQQVTSYQSHFLIDSHFQWHKALQFDNIIIGYANTSILIKGKDKALQSIDLYSPILALYSINQYKVLYITQKQIGTVNVRSYLLADEIKFQHYLGNRTLMKKERKQQQQSINQQSSQQQEQASLLSNIQTNNNTNSYWHQPYTKQFKQVRVVSVLRIQPTGELLILLSNGDLLMYIHSRIIQYTNLGVQLLRQLAYYGEDGNDSKQQLEIRMHIVGGYNKMMISSNRHSKLLIYNITIPNLTVNRESHFFAFLSPKANQLTSSYWITIDLHKSQVSNNYHRRKHNDLQQQQYSILPYSPQSFNNRQSSQETVIIYFTYLLSSAKQENNISLINPIIIIQQQRLLINLLQGNYMIGVSNNNSSEGRSYWWNILMIVMIVLGVVLFRKCNAGQHINKSKSKQQQYNQLYQLPEQYKRSKHNKPIDTKMRTSLTKQAKLLPKQAQAQHYQDQVISQLQSYLQKQGQKLTKSQISLLIRDIQAKQLQQQQQQSLRPKMRRQSPSQESTEYQVNQKNKQSDCSDSLQKKKKKKQ